MSISRRVLLGRFGAVVGAAALARRSEAAQGAQAAPPPPPFDVHRDYNPTADPVSYPDPDIVTIDPAFNALRVNNSAIHRLWTGGQWSEGPAWCSQGKYLVWSDVPMGVQRRWIDDDGRVTVFRNPSNNSNGNTFDFQGRQVTCEHTGRRIARYEHDGSITSIAEAYMGQRLNSPNDIAPHRDGSYWFTDPAAGFTLYEGAPEVSGGAGNADGRYNSRAGQPIGVGSAKREIMTANVYRVDPQSGRVDMMMSQSNLPGNPNYRKVNPADAPIMIMALTSDILTLPRMYDAADSRSMREQLISALASRKEPDATDKLIDIAKNSTDLEMRRLAINYLSRKNDPRATKLLMELIEK